MAATTVGAEATSGGNRNGGLERYLGNRIDMKWRFLFIWASKDRKMPRMTCRQSDPNTDF